jgi:hypothetical protein
MSQRSFQTSDGNSLSFCLLLQQGHQLSFVVVSAGELGWQQSIQDQGHSNPASWEAD